MPPAPEHLLEQPPAAATVLYVCTANICRSPMAERLVRAALSSRLGADAGQIGVTSAGVIGRDGGRMDSFAADVLRERGIDPEGFGGRLLRAEHIRESALVLVAAREHRSAVVRLVPRAVGRCFTLREFDRYTATVDPAALPAGDPSARLAALVAEVGGRRGTLSPAAPGADDVADPYQLGRPVMQTCAEQIAACSRRWVDLVASRT